MDPCTICNEPLQNGHETVKLTPKGSDGVNNASKLRENTIQVHPGTVVHLICRRDYCNRNKINQFAKTKTEGPSTSTRALRSNEPAFNFGKQCLFCGKSAKTSGRKRGSDVFPVTTTEFHSTIKRICVERGKDTWAMKVSSRVEFAYDLRALKAVYHQACSSNFRTGKSPPLDVHPTSQNGSTSLPAGRPLNDVREKAFQEVVQYLEDNDDEQITINDLVQKMEEVWKVDCCSFTPKHMKRRLEEHFGDSITIQSVNGKADVVTFRSTATAIILQQFYDAPKVPDAEAEKLRIVETAACLIKNEIKCMHTSKEIYPTSTDIACLEKNSEFVPKSLRLFLRKIFSEKNAKLKIASVGQTIVQAARPKVLIAPMQLGLAVQMHHVFGSRFIIDTLSRVGFCSSYHEVKRYEKSAATSQGTDIPCSTPDQSVQFVGDNADHDKRTLDGYDTFHGMGIIAAVTPGTKQEKPVPRLPMGTMTSKEIAAVGRIPIYSYKAPLNPASPLIYTELADLVLDDPTWKLDLLWKVAWPIRSPRPGWSGMMQAVSRGSYPGQSSVSFLPMIDMNSSDLSCIYSTLKFVCSESRRHQVHPIVTFDQPLWWKAQKIVAAEPFDSDLRKLVLRLGGFHTEMNFIGCIGHIMAGSGLQELLQLVYAPNTVLHMLSGKAVSRAVRGHFLVDSVLNAMITASAFKLSLPEVRESEKEDQLSLGTDVSTHANDQEQHEIHEGASKEPLPSDVVDDSNDQEQHEIHEDLKEVIRLYDKLMSDEMSVDAICSEDVFERVQHELDGQKQAIACYPTARMWVQYMSMVDLLRQFIKAERTGDWDLHLETLNSMLPYFAAAGHNLYAKSVHIYIQQMPDLKTKHPDVDAFFRTGHHVIRRSNRYWAGLSSDLIIEQMLMRSMKTSGGLTRGRGMGESQRTQWLLSMPACSALNVAMQDLTDMFYMTSDQHTDMSKARQARDEKDKLTMLGFLNNRDPFVQDTHLHSIATGVAADSTVNADRSKEVGSKILDTMTGKDALEYTFKKKDHVITMANKVSAKIDGDVIQVDPQLLFQRLILAAGDDSETVPSIFKYELSSLPSSLFQPDGLFRAANKPALCDAIWNVADGTNMPGPPSELRMSYVIDGGALIQRLLWPRDASFDSICSMYADYIQKKYINSTVVFDGYGAGPSTKDHTHRRRSGGVIGPEVKFVGSMHLTSKKEHFLANETNKQKFIDMLSENLQLRGINCLHAHDDADLLIVKTAVESSTRFTTTLIGDDTDLLILLCFHADLNAYDLFFRSEGKQTTKTLRVWNIKWLKNKLGQEICSLLPFVHAVTGCDTTSRLFGIGKGMALKKLGNHEFKQQAEVFSRQSTKEEIVCAGERALVCLYGGCRDESLDELRFKKFKEKVASRTSAVQVNTLPPTTGSAYYHSTRVYLQVQTWIDLHVPLDPERWGWVLAKGRLEPLQTDLPPAPDTLLKVIRCNCKSQCDTRKCTCRKHGLDCSVICGECKGINCSNSTSLSLDTIAEDL